MSFLPIPPPPKKRSVSPSMRESTIALGKKQPNYVPPSQLPPEQLQTAEFDNTILVDKPERTSYPLSMLPAETGFATEEPTVTRMVERAEPAAIIEEPLAIEEPAVQYQEPAVVEDAAPYQEPVVEQAVLVPESAAIPSEPTPVAPMYVAAPVPAVAHAPEPAPYQPVRNPKTPSMRASTIALGKKQPNHVPPSQLPPEQLQTAEFDNTILVDKPERTSYPLSMVPAETGFATEKPASRRVVEHAEPVAIIEEPLAVEEPAIQYQEPAVMEGPPAPYQEPAVVEDTLPVPEPAAMPSEPTPVVPVYVAAPVPAVAHAPEPAPYQPVRNPKTPSMRESTIALGKKQPNHVPPSQLPPEQLQTAEFDNTILIDKPERTSYPLSMLPAETGFATEKPASRRVVEHAEPAAIIEEPLAVEEPAIQYQEPTVMEDPPAPYQEPVVEQAVPVPETAAIPLEPTPVAPMYVAAPVPAVVHAPEPAPYQPVRNPKTPSMRESTIALGKKLPNHVPPSQLPPEQLHTAEFDNTILVDKPERISYPLSMLPAETGFATEKPASRRVVEHAEPAAIIEEPAVQYQEPAVVEDSAPYQEPVVEQAVPVPESAAIPSEPAPVAPMYVAAPVPAVVHAPEPAPYQPVRNPKTPSMRESTIALGKKLPNHVPPSQLPPEQLHTAEFDNTILVHKPERTSYPLSMLPAETGFATEKPTSHRVVEHAEPVAFEEPAVQYQEPAVMEDAVPYQEPVVPVPEPAAIPSEPTPVAPMYVAAPVPAVVHAPEPAPYQPVRNPKTPSMRESTIALGKKLPNHVPPSELPLSDRLTADFPNTVLNPPRMPRVSYPLSMLPAEAGFPTTDTASSNIVNPFSFLSTTRGSVSAPQSQADVPPAPTTFQGRNAKTPSMREATIALGKKQPNYVPPSELPLSARLTADFPNTVLNPPRMPRVSYPLSMLPAETGFPAEESNVTRIVERAEPAAIIEESLAIEEPAMQYQEPVVILSEPTPVAPMYVAAPVPAVAHAPEPAPYQPVRNPKTPSMRESTIALGKKLPNHVPPSQLPPEQLQTAEFDNTILVDKPERTSYPLSMLPAETGFATEKPASRRVVEHAEPAAIIEEPAMQYQEPAVMEDAVPYQEPVVEQAVPVPEPAAIPSEPAPVAPMYVAAPVPAVVHAPEPAPYQPVRNPKTPSMRESTIALGKKLPNHVPPSQLPPEQLQTAEFDNTILVDKPERISYPLSMLPAETGFPTDVKKQQTVSSHMAAEAPSPMATADATTPSRIAAAEYKLSSVESATATTTTSSPEGKVYPLLRQAMGSKLIMSMAAVGAAALTVFSIYKGVEMYYRFHLAQCITEAQLKEPNVVHLYIHQRSPLAPSVSVPCSRVEMFLRLAKIPYEPHVISDASVSPTGQLPFVVHGATRLAGAQDIIDYITITFDVPMDRALSTEQRATGVTVLSALDYSLTRGYLRSVMVDKPDCIQPYYSEMNATPSWITRLALRRMKNKIEKQQSVTGYGRLTPQQYVGELERDASAIDALLTSTAFLFTDDHPTSYDCALFAWLLPIAAMEGASHVNNAFKRLVRSKHVVDYIRRMSEAVYPEYADIIVSGGLDGGGEEEEEEGGTSEMRLTPRSSVVSAASSHNGSLQLWDSHNNNHHQHQNNNNMLEKVLVDG